MEKAPALSKRDFLKAILELQNNNRELYAFIEDLNEEYEYWDKIKYKKNTFGKSSKELWALIKVQRLTLNVSIPGWEKYNAHFALTNKMQRQCHDFDMNYGGRWGTESIIPDNAKERYLISSLMEEAISSSLMEGASTTRKVAKEMLRNKKSPKDKSQQMIFNNYETIQFIVSHKSEPLTKELLLQVHQLMTDKTLDNPEDAGRFRQNDEVVVENAITHEIVHTPPSFTELPQFVDTLCSFFNGTESKPYIHPVIKGIIIHYMIAYMHPFVDGNGRTARAIFYWYMLRQGYWLMEYLSISRIIYRGKSSYEKSFLYAEIEDNDLGYFLSYNLRVLELAFKDMQRYIMRKIKERQAAHQYLGKANINERQAEIIKMFDDNPNEILVVKDVQNKFAVTPTTAKSDIVKLVQLGLLREIQINKVKKAYLRSENFERILSNL